MKLQILRYYKDSRTMKGTLMVDGTPFCETREANSVLHQKYILPAGEYRCKCFASALSPMTLKVCRERGKAAMMVGFDVVRQWKVGMICLGQADPSAPAEERELDRQQETFEAFTGKVYKAYSEDESITLEIAEPDEPDM